MLFLLLANFAGPGYAQEHRASFGLRGGIGFANITNPGHFKGKFSYKLHTQLGIFAEIKVAKPLFLQVELLYSNPGTRLFQIDQNGYKTRDSLFNFNCLQVPVQVKFKTKEGLSPVKGYYMVGVAPSYLFNANLKYKIDSTSTTFFDYTYYETRLTFNLVNTVGIEIDIDRAIVPFIDFRYVQGLTNVHKARAAKPETNLQFLLSGGIRF